MPKSADRPDKEDLDLFEREMGDVRRLRHNEAQIKRSSQAARFPAKEAEEATPSEALDSLHFRRPGVPTTTFRKLKRGQLPVEATTDLHGMKSEEAEVALHRFILHARSKRMRVVRVIHGKGLGVLRTSADQALRKMSVVLAFCACPPSDGGTGAAYVLLKR
jgi:DNA-nicking Smr family endonuclease